MKKLAVSIVSLFLVFSASNAFAWYFEINTSTNTLSMVLEGDTISGGGLSICVTDDNDIATGIANNALFAMGWSPRVDYAPVAGGLFISLLPSEPGTQVAYPELLYFTVPGASNLRYVNSGSTGMGIGEPGSKIIMYYDDLLVGGHLRYTSAVPIPSAIWLFISGLIGLVGVRKKLKKT